MTDVTLPPFPFPTPLNATSGFGGAALKLPRHVWLTGQSPAAKCILVPNYRIWS